MEQNLYKRPSRGNIAQSIIVILTICIFIMSPLILCIIVFAFSFRSCLKWYVKQFKPEYGKIVSLGSTSFATDVPNKASTNSVIATFVFDGTVDVDKLKIDIMEKVKEKNRNGKLKYPELQQTLSFFCGYAFWKWDKDFDINKHIHLGYNGSTTLNDDVLNEISAQLLRKPFERSPWEILIFPEYLTRRNMKPKFAVLVRFSHCLADAFSIVQIMAETGGVTLKPRTSQNTGKSLRRKIISRAKSLALLPYQLLGSFYDTCDQRLKHPDSENLVVRHSEAIPISRIKNLKIKFGTSFGSVLLAAYTGGLRKLMLANKIELPYALHTITPLPMLGHKDKLRNKMKFGYVVMPVGVSDPVTRLRHIESTQKAAASSRIPSQSNYLNNTICQFPIAVVRQFASLLPQSGMVTNFASLFAKGQLSYKGRSLEEVISGLGTHHGNLGIIVASFSYADTIRIHTNFVYSAILREINPDVLLDGVLEELKILEETDIGLTS